VIAVAYGSAFAWTGHLIGQAETAYGENHLSEARELLDRASWWRVRRARVRDALGVVELASGRLDEAKAHLDAARGLLFHPAAFGVEDVLLSFLRSGLYEPAMLYAGHRYSIDEKPEVALYLAIAENGLNRIDDAESHLLAAQADPSLGKEIETQRLVLAAKRKSGRWDYLVDRHGDPLAAIDIATGKEEIIATGLAGLIQAPAGIALEPRDRSNRVVTTLDLEIQRAAEAALGAQRGALVVLDVETGGVLAAASQPVVHEHKLPSMSRIYEPGSIIKMITLAAALRKGVDLDDLFPMDCPGWILIDDVAFRDWLTHGKVESIEEAVAVSCNIAFARLGAAVGRDALNAELRRFGFETSTAQSGVDFPFMKGTLLPEEMEHPNYSLARRAVGLDSLTITPIHAAMIAASLARGGAPVGPYMIRDKTNLLGESYHVHGPTQAGADDALPPEDAALLVRTMRAAMGANGTGRRAAVDDLSTAMKTGTSGKNPPGYDALVIGFAPAEDPAIAWGLIGENAGKAQLAGTRITREFLVRAKEAIAGWTGTASSR
jgi:peptidoglycan glycosyltransferase